MKKYLIAGLLILNLSVFFIIFSWLNFQTGVYFLNVGQGDATLIKERVANILIDAGPYNSRAEQELDKILPFYKRNIDLAIITHPDSDHFAGLFDLLKTKRPSAVIYSGLESRNFMWQELKKTLTLDKIPLLKINQGQEIIFGQSKLKIIYPGRNILLSNLSENDKSLVILASQKNKNFLLMADVTSQVENQIAGLIGQIKINILKIAHHGSKYSSSLEFLKSVKPDFSIISVGKNNYGQPAALILQRIWQIGSQILRTDILGTVGF